MDPIRITPPRWEGEIKWQDLDGIVDGLLMPNPEFIRRMAYELRSLLEPKPEIK